MSLAQTSASCTTPPLPYPQACSNRTLGFTPDFQLYLSHDFPILLSNQPVNRVFHPTLESTYHKVFPSECHPNLSQGFPIRLLTHLSKGFHIRLSPQPVARFSRPTVNQTCHKVFPSDCQPDLLQGGQSRPIPPMKIPEQHHATSQCHVFESCWTQPGAGQLRVHQGMPPGTESTLENSAQKGTHNLFTSIPSIFCVLDTANAAPL